MELFGKIVLACSNFFRNLKLKTISEKGRAMRCGDN